MKRPRLGGCCRMHVRCRRGPELGGGVVVGIARHVRGRCRGMALHRDRCDSGWYCLHGDVGAGADRGAAVKRSEKVSRALEAGGADVLDGFGAVRWFRFGTETGQYLALDLWVGERRVEVTVSPTGRSVRVFVDGVEVKS